jgi:hypothetical protein
MTVRHEAASFTAGYAYSTENDYRSNSFNVAARAEPFARSTQLEISYAHNFDQVCDRAQATGSPATLLRPLEDSSGCFTSDPARVVDGLSVDTLRASWSQAWTSAFATELVYDLEVRDGFQGNPYRSVVITDGQVAQEHLPGDRSRQSGTLHAHIYLRPLRAALRLSMRGYDDSWGVVSETGGAEFEKYIGEAFRLLVRGRFYNQGGADFWSDDYSGGALSLASKGEYWAGDRALSPFWSWLGGVRGIYTVASEHGRLLGMMTRLKVGASFDMQGFNYSQFTLGGASVGNSYAYFGGFTLSALF